MAWFKREPETVRGSGRVKPTITPEQALQDVASLRSGSLPPEDVAKESLANRRVLQRVLRDAAMVMARQVQYVRDTNGVRRADAVEAPVRIPDKRNHLTLVELHRIAQLGVVPRKAWEPTTFLYKEAVRFGIAPILDYVDELYTRSQSVDGVRAQDLVRSMVGDKPGSDHVAALGDSRAQKREAK